MTPEEEEVRALIARIPVLAGHDGPLERLGGLTNIVYRAGGHCLRLPGRGTEAYIDRGHERIAAAEAARVGVSPALLHFDAATGVMVTRFVAGAVTMTPAGFRSRPGAPARAARVLARLHRSGAVFPARFDLFAVMDGYRRLLAPRGARLPAGFDDALDEAALVRAALDARPALRVACHCDPLCENFLDLGGHMLVVDWEYSGMNDPMWDLGDLSVEAGFDDGQDAAMLQAYFDGDPRPADHGRMVIYKAMSDLLWTLWGLIQHADGNPAEDFAAYAAARFARCRALMAGPDFARHLAAITA